ncbi:hypothetical protein [uncultured Rikenella sp.]|uniref:hypothetical protein n=1 Tax=uncultured Rikenella sp. TaxID=368003 RepID=UPI0025FE63F8|nr:hypothetical protein [uncultured Rikenella sp.]
MLNYAGNEGNSWSSTVSGVNSVYLRFVSYATQPTFALSRGFGFQLRCLSE